eukprot:2536993-Amphidinium_carterae.1
MLDLSEAHIVRAVWLFSHGAHPKTCQIASTWNPVLQNQTQESLCPFIGWHVKCGRRQLAKTAASFQMHEA